MLLSIGYQGLKTADLMEVLGRRGATHLLDCRSKPYSRNAEYSKANLSDAVRHAGLEYQWVGDRLGGFSAISEEALDWLMEFQEGKTVCLMCMEADPRECHRYQEIGRRLATRGVAVGHIIFNKGFDALIHTGRE